MRLSRKQVLVALDQATSSATNFGGAALAAGLLTQDDFGAYAVATAVFSIALGTSRSWTGDRLMLEAHVDDAPSRTAMAIGSVGAAGVLGILVGVVMATGALLVDSESLRLAMLVIAAFAPAILFQDAARYVAIVHGAPKHALRSDLTWFVLTVAGLMVLRRTDTRSITLAVLAWTLPAGIAAVQIARALDLGPSWRDALTWLGDARSLSVRMSADYLLNVLSGFAVLQVVVASADQIGAAGSVRASQAALGPLVVVFTASTLIFQPMMVRKLSSGGRIVADAVRLSSLNTLISLAWLSLVLVVPDRYAVRVFGESWAGAREILGWIGAAFALIALSSGPLNGLRSMRRVSMGLAIQGVAGTVTLVLAVVGARTEGVDGAVRGFVAGSTVSPVLAWGAFLWSNRQAGRGWLVNTGARTASVE